MSRIKQLEKELARKEKALAEAAALLILSKKAQAIWGGERGRLIDAKHRQVAIELVDEAACAGARRSQACAVLGLSLRTLQRWQSESEPDLTSHDRRKGSTRYVVHRLSEAERAEILSVCNQPRFASLPPSQIVPALAHEGVYLASESSLYRILRTEDQQQHRGRSAPATPASPPQWVESGSRQIWSWDITYLPSAIRGQFHLLYLVMDVFSRKIVGWEVYDSESADLASVVLQRAYLAEGIAGQDLTLHSDNGASMKEWLSLMQEFQIDQLAEPVD